MTTRDPAERAVAVVGVGAILPDAHDAPSFWRNVTTGRDSISEVPADRWNVADYFDTDRKAPGKTYSKIGGWVKGMVFDATRLRIPPRVAAQMDEGQKWALLSALEALKDAGHPDRPLDLESTGVIVGNAMAGEHHYASSLGIYWPEFGHALEASAAFAALPAATRRAILDEWVVAIRGRFPEITEDTMPGELSNVIAGRIAAVLNLRGPNYTTDAACASTMAALDAALQGLTDHHFDAVITGGMDRNMGANSFVKFSKVGALSADGSRPYAKGANGFVMGEGGAMFVLKRIADAERAGDRIYAVVRAIGGSSDGKGKGITAPNPVGQVLAVKRAWARAGLDPATMTLLEGHGTSTAVGDVVETTAAVEAIGDIRGRRIALGSVKSQIGHLKSGAGAAALLKTVLALHHKVLPPSINFREPNPEIPFDRIPLYVNVEAQPWERPSYAPRRAGVSSFGFGGTNFHIVVEEYIPGGVAPRKTQVSVPGAPEGGGGGGSGGGGGGVRADAPSPVGDLLALGAADRAGIKAALERALAEARAGRLPARRLPEAAVLAAPVRLIIAFNGAADLVQKGESTLAAFARPEKEAIKTWRVLRSKGVFLGEGAPGKLAIMFPGQGSQYVNMLRQLRDFHPVVAATFAEADEVMAPHLGGRPLTSFIFVDAADVDAVAAAEKALRDTTVCQPAMLTCDVAMARLLAVYGIEPDMVIGHSLGEWSAAVAAGMVTLRDALVAVSARAKGMAAVAPPDPGKMASVLGPYEEVVRRLEAVQGYVVPANLNALNQTVIAGESEAVLRAVEMFNAAGMTAQTIPVSHAFHSRIVGAASDALARVIGEMQLSRPRVPVIGNVTGERYPEDMEQIKRLLATQLASPVQFVKGLQTLYADGVRVFVEVGPKRVLAGFADNVVGQRDGVLCLSTNHPKTGDLPSLHLALCGLWAAGRGRAAAPVTDVPEVRPMTMRAPEPAPLAARSDAPRAGQPDYPALGRLFADFLQQGMAMLQGGAPAPAAAPAAVPAPVEAMRVQGVGPQSAQSPVFSGSVVVSGAGLGLPGAARRMFDDGNFDRILEGDIRIEPIPAEQRQRMLEKNVVRLTKHETGEPSFEAIADVADVIKLAGRKGAFDLAQEFGVAPERVEAYDVTTALAVAAGIEALRDARIPLIKRYRRTTTGSYLPDRWLLPRSFADETGVIFASCFSGFDNLVDHVERFHADRLRRAVADELQALREGLPTRGNATAKVEKRLAELREAVASGAYRFDRRFMFQILSMGHSQFAELIGARGPNSQVNTACASTAHAMSIAEDWIRLGRCRRVLVVSADDVTSDRLLGWIGAGFLATGAASVDERVEDAVLPFDRRRHGMLLGMGAAALVVESQDALEERGMRGLVELLSTETANSAFHGTRLDIEHIGLVMERLVDRAERRFGLRRDEMAREMVFVSHETHTPARGGSAAAEVHALRRTFGTRTDQIIVANTKGFTGHPMGVGIEDVVAVKILEKRLVPPVPNFKEPDPDLGTLNLSKGGPHRGRYVLRLAAGFGSQVGMTLARRVARCEERIVDQAAYDRWVSAMAGYPQATLEVVQRTLRVRDQGAPKQEPAVSAWEYGTGPMKWAEAEGVAKGTAPAIATATPSSTTTTATTTTTPPAVAVAAAATVMGGDEVAEKVLAVVADKTGYARDMLALDLDLEADLGIDTVKQAEVFATVREAFDIPRQEGVKLRDYPTLGHVIGFVRTMRPDLAAAAAAMTTSAAMAAAATTTAAAPVGDEVAEKVLAVVSEKTGYPRDMLELDLDLEADLGIDTVKQAEVFATVREAFDIPRQEGVKLRDYPTLGHVIGFVRTMRPDLAAAATAAAATSTASMTAATATAAATATVAAAATAAGGDEVAEKVLAVVADKTGYPRDMLELDLDLEADLGIDTVKQAEVFATVREVFEIPRQNDLKLRDYPTLGHVIGFVRTMRPDLAAAAAARTSSERAATATATAATATTTAPTTTGAATGDEVAEKVLAVVADKTGYPRDMLELDLDLEADLGIDTVKQAEVFATVREAFGIPRQNDLKLRDYPTLSHVIGFVRKFRPAEQAASAKAAQATGAAAAEEAPAPAGDNVLLRYPVPVVRPAIEHTPRAAVQLEGLRVVILPDKGGVAEALAAALEKRGAEVLRVDGDRAAVEKALSQVKAAPVGLFHLAALDAEPAFEEIPDEAWRAHLGARIEPLHAASRALYEQLGAGSFVVAATRMGGVHGYEDAGAKHATGGVVTGFVKTLSRERGEALVKAVDFAEDAPNDEIARTLLAEAERDPGAVEVGWRDGQRFGIGLLTLSPRAARKPLALDADTVFLVTGAAGAITSVIVRDLAAASRGTFHLVDARPEPDEATRAEVRRMAEDREALKRAIFDRIKAETGRATPAQVEKRLFDLERAAAILDVMAGIEQAGGRAFYHSADVTSAAAVGKVAEAIRKNSKRLDVIVHAAGLERSRSLDSKPVEEFDLVLGVKADGLHHLLSATRDLDPRALVCFSSVAGRFGNAGQADYSAGNDLLCKAASSWAARHPEALAVVLDWTAWGGIGMATRGNIPEIMRRAGIEMLAPDDGVPVIRTLLGAGFCGEAVVGRRLGILIAPRVAGPSIDGPALLAGLPAGTARSLPFGEVSHDLYQGLRIDFRVDPREQPFLKDHEIDGTPVLPGVMGLEGFAQAAALAAPGLRVSAIESVRFMAPLKFFRREPRTATLRALPVREADGRVRVRATLSSSRPLPGGQTEEKVHFSAVVVLEDDRQPVQLPRVEATVAEGRGIDHEAIYKVYFHGPAYRVLDRAVKGQNALVGMMAQNLPPDIADPKAGTLFAPRLVELCFQTAGVYEIGATGYLGLPAAAERVAVTEPPAQAGPLVAEVFPRREDDGNGGALCFDARVRDEQGRVYVDLKGYRTARLPDALPAERLAPFRNVVGG